VRKHWSVMTCDSIGLPHSLHFSMEEVAAHRLLCMGLFSIFCCFRWMAALSAANALHMQGFHEFVCIRP